MSHESVPHVRSRAQRAPAAVRIPLFAIALFATFILIHQRAEAASESLSKSYTDSWTSNQGVADVSGVARSRKLLQMHSERPVHQGRRVIAAQSGRKVHSTAWELADAAKDGTTISMHELRALVDRFARLLSTSDSYQGDAALFLEDFEQWHYQNSPPVRNAESEISSAPTAVLATPAIQSI